MAELVLSLLLLTAIKATPIVYAALGGVLSERAGVLNIGLEGMMVAGAFFAVLASHATGNAFAGLLCGIGAGAVVGYFFGLAATKFRVDQIVAGTGVNLICTGGAAFGLQLAFGQPGASAQVPSLGSWYWILIVVAFAAALGMSAFLYWTPAGLRVRACGENPRAVAATGLNPLRLRLGAVVAGGALAGLGGAFLSIGELDLFSDGMTAGRGFIALAAVIFGRWTPLGATGAALIFGAFEAGQFAIAQYVPWFPANALAALPYVAAIVALTGIAGRARAPQADGVPYEFVVQSPQREA